MERVHGVVQHYNWGDTDAIPRLIGAAPDGRPWAELWLGTHPGGPSTVGSPSDGGDGGTVVGDEEDARTLADVSGPLPYLLKVLAAAEPLSLQTHPTTEQAVAGFAREHTAGIAPEAPERIYRDPSAKPELLCALTPFEAVCGFRPHELTLQWFTDQGWDELASRLSLGPESFVRWALSTDGHRVPDDAPGWVRRIAARYPGDGGAVVALLMNHVTLAPDEAIFLSAGNLHAYLQGVGVEIMGNSDNVIRGGLTSKHVDIEELLAVVDFTPLIDPVVHALEATPGSFVYETADTPFRLWRLEIGDSLTHTAEGRELLLCTAGDAGELKVGETVYLAAGETIDLIGPSTIFRVEER